MEAAAGVESAEEFVAVVAVVGVVAPVVEAHLVEVEVLEDTVASFEVGVEVVLCLEAMVRCFR